jgi:hypothetical protein
VYPNEQETPSPLPALINLPPPCIPSCIFLPYYCEPCRQSSSRIIRSRQMKEFLGFWKPSEPTRNVARSLICHHLSLVFRLEPLGFLSRRIDLQKVRNCHHSTIAGQGCRDDVTNELKHARYIPPFRNALAARPQNGAYLFRRGLAETCIWHRCSRILHKGQPG